MIAQVILIEVTPKQASDGADVVLRLAGGGALKPYRYGGFDTWRAGVVTLPSFVASLEFTGGDFPAGSIPAAAELVWAPARSADLAIPAGLVWFDAPITVRIGAEGDALPPVAITGRVLDASAGRDGRLKIVLADPAASLKKPFLTSRYAGTGGLEGPVEWEGRIKDRIFGRIWNKRGEPIDKANNIYCFADPARPIQAFDAVRDKGAAAAALNVLAWQGSLAATLAALQAAAAPPGGGVICPSIACVKWWTQPAGELCADLKGEVGAGYVETAASIAARLVAAAAGPAFAAGTVAAADAARTAIVGCKVDDDVTTTAALLDALLGDVSLMWLLDSSQQIVLRPWEWGASVASAVSHDVARLKVLRPVAGRKIGYQRNETRLTRDSLAAIVLTDRSASAPPAMAEGALWIAPDGHPYRFGTLPWASGGSAWLGTGGTWLGSGYADAQDQAGPTALAELADLADDGIISINEKVTKLIPDQARLAEKYGVLTAQAATIGVSAAAAVTAKAAWDAMLAALSPAWDNITADSAVDRAVFDTARTGLDQALYDLDAAIKAGVTAALQVTVAPPAGVIVYCDQTGVAKAGQLPKVLTPVVTRGGTDIRADNAASYAITAPAQLAASINNMAGSADKGRITIGTGWTGPGTIQLTVTVSGVAYGPFPIAVDRVNDQPSAPSGGGGGSGPAYDSTFSSVSSTAFVAISDELGPLTITSGQKLVVTAPLDYTVDCTGETTRKLVAKAQYWDGAAWVDFPASPVNGSNAYIDPGAFTSDAGSINLSQEKTGLAAGSWKVRLVAALNNSAPAATISVSSGTMTFSVV